MNHNLARRVTASIAIASLGLTVFELTRVSEAIAASVVFRQGQTIILNTVDTGVVYTGTQDTSLSDKFRAVSQPKGDNPRASVDGSPVIRQFLVRFDSIFGNELGQIPVGSTINSATLQLYIVNAGDGMTLHRILGDWNEATATWNNFKLNGNSQPGLQGDGIEATNSLQSVLGIGDTGIRSFRSINVTDDLQLWSSQAIANYGWGWLPTGSNDVRWYSSEFKTVNLRPALTINFTPIPTPALLPGLVGLGIGVWQKLRTQKEASK